MTTNYDDIADDYHLASQEHPIKTHLEAFTLLQVAGDIQGQAVLDLACGDGYYTRLLKRHGASRVLGVDLSAEMIARARMIETDDPLGLEYRVQDVTKLARLGPFDLVTAIYLLPYAATVETLTAMARTIYDNLKPDGRLVAITLNPDLAAADLAIYDTYGLTMTTPGALQDGSVIQTRIRAKGISFELSTYFWGQATCETILRDVGFSRIAWHSIRVSEAGRAAFAPDYWQPLLAKPYSVVLECRR